MARIFPVVARTLALATTLIIALIAIGFTSTAALAFDSSDGKKIVSAPHPAPLTAKARLQPSKIEPGGTAELILDLELVERYHAYLDKFKLSIESPDDIKFDRLKVAPIVQFKDVVTKTMKDGVQGKSTMRALIEVPQGYKAGAFTAKVKLIYQACTDEFCLFPKTVHLEAPFAVITTPTVSAAPPGPPNAPITSVDGDNDFLRALKKGLLPAVMLMFVAGFLTSLTPCVYPMIPITLAVLGAREKNQSHLKSFSLALVYVLGIAVTYSGLGVVAASTGTLFGSALGNVWVVTALALVFVAMGIGMYGYYEIQAPAFVRDRLGGASGGKSRGYPGAFATGLFAGIVASPCIGPVLVSVLAYIAQTRDQFLGFVLLFSFAIGMGTLFLALGMSSSLIRKIPRAGGWMDSVKYLFGTVMIGMAFYYVHPVYPAWLFQALLGIAVLGLAVMFGRIRKVYALPVLAIGLATMVFISKMPGKNTEGSFPKLAWQTYSDQAREEALKKGQPILIDFTAEWCGACKELEKYTFTDPRVREISEKFALLKFDATEESPALDALRERYKILGLPTLVFYDGAGKLRTELTVTGFEKADVFLEKMAKAAQRDTQSTAVSQ